MTGRAPERETTATGAGAETAGSDATGVDPTPGDAGPRRRTAAAVRPLLLTAIPALVTVVVVALVLGAGAYPLLGLADPGPVVRLATPVLRVLADLAAAACLGVLVRALLLDAPRSGPSPALLRVAAAAGGGWAVAAAGTALLTVADASGGSLAGEDLLLGLLVRAAPLGWLLTAVLAAVVAVWAREVRTWSSGAGVLLLAVLALLGPVVTGHAIDGVGHDLGLPATAWHVVAATVWLGTLGAAAVGADARTRWRARRITGACAAVVLLSGVVQALVLVPRADDWASPYGVLVALAAVVTLVALPRLGGRDGRRGTPGTSGLRWIAAELALLGVVTGLSVAMTRAVPPVQDPGHASPPEALLGYALADPPSALTLLTHWRLDLWFTPLAVVLAVGYALALRRAPGWPRGRAACWFAGCAVLVVATSSGLGRYGPALLSVHVAAHMLLSTVVPILLVLGGPITLLRRVLPEGGDVSSTAGTTGTTDGDDDREGPRDWLEHALAAPSLRGVSHPLVATVLMVGSPFLLYLTPVFSLTQPIGWLQPPMTAWFLGVGLVFAWVLVGVDPSPHPIPYVARLTLLLASMPFHALFGVLLLSADEPISRTPSTLVAASGGGQLFVADFYERLSLPWAPDLLADQQLAAALTWAMGDLPLLAAVVVLLVQWQRHAAAEDRATREEFVGLRS